jgi:hypothetical protein
MKQVAKRVFETIVGLGRSAEGENPSASRSDQAPGYRTTTTDPVRVPPQRDR